MKTLVKPATKTNLSLHHTGLGMTGLSSLIFMLPEWRIAAHDGAAFGIFWLNYGLAILYFVILILKGHFSFRRPFEHPEHLYLLLVLAIISCYSLNRQMHIFQDSAPWLEAQVTLFCVALAGYSFEKRLPYLLTRILLFVLGTGAVLWTYYALYLAPLYLIGALGIVALGIGLHAFVPLWVVLTLGFGVKKAAATDRGYLRSFFAGTAASLLLLAFFLGQWRIRDKQISFYSNEHILQGDETLPRWVKLSQQLPADYLTERIMKTDLIYQLPADHFRAWDLPHDNFNEVKRHDPLVMLAVFLLGKPALDRQEKVKILESLYDARHQAEQWLWSGNNLSTTHVVSQVQVFPQYRLAYTEKVLSVHNNLTNSGNQQEAIYTFFLPEGSVVSSLSLWINGREEKGLLTTKGKAQTAYHTIVGKERRDPSVVHWQEGNRVSVRVFPCTPNENRQFKIGVTSPLRQEGRQLVYDDIYFTGPSAASAIETSVIYLAGPVQDLRLPVDYRQVSSNEYRRQGSYTQDWGLRFSAPPLASSNFSFGGSSYQLVAVPQRLEAFAPQRLYLDINASWSARELEQVWNLAKRGPAYVWDGQMTQLTEDNREQMFGRLRQQQYSLFPFHKVQGAGQALVISKSTAVSPNLSDLKDTPFAEEMAEALPLQPAIRVYALGELLSPYLKSLQELQVIAIMGGDAAHLARLLQQKQFIPTTTDQNTVRLGRSGAGILKTAAAAAGPAPDHLLRLFAYNHLLQQIGPRYFCQDHLEEELIGVAAQANIVSPVSSLIVLERQADYARFDIQKSKDSLGNASLHASGSVPEPEEWALIILAIVLVATLTLKSCLLR
jgi:XrtN system VIT domain protein